METARTLTFDYPRLHSSPPWPQVASADAAVLFLKNELDLGLTFSWVALCSRTYGWKQKVDRNTRAARRAYDSLMHFRCRVSLTPSQLEAYEGGLGCLRERLLTLGEAI